MADAAVSSLVENVSQLLKSNFDLISGAENELQQLKNDLILLKPLEKPNKDEVMKEILERQIKEVVYEAEDTIDSCLTKSSPVSLSEEVRSLRENKVKAMLEKANWQMGDGSGESEEQPRKKVQLTRQHDVGIVGFEDEERTIIGYLMEKTMDLDVISIIGMRGLGKTTLARKIYQDPQIEYEFPVRIWVCVSQEFSRKDVFLNIVKQLTDQDMSSLNDQELASMVRGYLEREKFLLVMDDIWTTNAWNAVKYILPRSNGMGKVLITSRCTDVGLHASAARRPHNLRFLNQDESWELLRLEVFGNLESCPEELQHIAESIAKNCNGLALAIVVIGGIILEPLSRGQAMDVIRDEWANVSHNLNNYLVGEEGRCGISEIVSWSYGAMAHDLRDCFLYLGVFPEDYEVPAWALTSMWIAEGFIQYKQGQSLEETAEENLMDLINRNLLMVGKTSLDGQIKTCRVHDVIRAFCISKAAEHNLFREIKVSDQGVFDPPASEMPNCRRISIHSHLSEFLSEKLSGPRLRSFLCFYKELFVLHPEYISAIPRAFNLLRVFESKSIKFTRFPMKFTKNLIHLKYISLSCDDLDILPETISDLWNLQTLVVETELPSLEVRANIWRMIRLRHLKTKAAIVLTVKGEGNANENLQTLTRLSPETCTDQVFKKAHNLRSLGIRGKLATLFESKGLEKLDRLEKLKLVNDLFYESSVSTSRLQGLPPPNCFPPHLRRLTLSATFLDWEQMATLEKIDTLEVLKLKNKAFTGECWRIDDHGFCRLQCLLIENTNLVYWDSSTDSFPSLRYLVLQNCENLKEIPIGLAKSLEKLDIERVSKSAVESAIKIEELKKMEDRRGGSFKLSVGPGCRDGH